MKARTVRWFASPTFYWRGLLALIAVIAFTLAVAVWLYTADRTNREVTKVTTTSKVRTSPEVLNVVVSEVRDGDRSVGHARSPARLATTTQNTVLTEKTSPASTDDNQALIIGLLGLAAALLLTSVFFGRVTEVGLLGMNFKIAPELAAAVRDVSVEAGGDPQLTADALRDFLLDLGSRAWNRDLGVEDVEKARDRAISRLNDQMAAEVSVEETREGIRIDVKTPEDAPVRVTTTPQLLPQSVFDPSAVAEIAGMPSRDLGRELYAIEGASEEVLAALGFEIDPSSRRVVIDAFTMHRAEHRQAQAAMCATVLMSYMREVAKKVGGDRHVFLRHDTEPTARELQSLGWLGMRPATADETVGFGPGVYWIDTAS
jgi:hypothetical protein